MSERDTMFNKRDQKCAAVQLMLSTDPTYDNRTIASTLKMQIRIATINRAVPRVMKTKFPATVMVFGVVSSQSHIMPPHIFEVGLKVNTKMYLDVLKSVVITGCNPVAGGRPWVWQQDSAPAHKSKETQACLVIQTQKGREIALPFPLSVAYHVTLLFCFGCFYVEGILWMFQGKRPVGRACNTLTTSPAGRQKPSKSDILNMTVNCVWWWGSSSGVWNRSSITITPRFTLTQNGNICEGPINVFK